MRIADLRAEPDARGGSILLTWTNPADATFAGVKVLRRESEFPLVPDDLGTSFEIYDSAAAPGSTGIFRDSGRLQGQTTYYYAVVARDSSAQLFPAYITAMATSFYGSGAYLYGNLPEIYRTFDTFVPPDTANIDPADRSKGQLRRFVEMFGLQFDLLRSFASGMRNFYDIERIDGNLLPLLAQWIGWQTDFTLPIPKQRNEVHFAPHFYRTTGIPANLRAMVNRISTWDALIKEAAHNIFRSNDPEQLTISQMDRKGGVWQQAEQTTLDAAHEGRVSTLLAADGRPFIFYHAREDAPAVSSSATSLGSHIWYKAWEKDGWLGSRRLTAGASVDRSPTAVQRADGSIWLFWSGYADAGGRLVPATKLQVLAAGRGALPARIQGTAGGPFTVADGDQFRILITASGITFDRTITLRAEDFAGAGPVSSDALAAVLNRELPYVGVSVVKGQIIIESQQKGASSKLQVPASTVATMLGIAPVIANGTDALGSQLIGSAAGPFALVDGDQLLVLRNGDNPRAVTFHKEDFAAIAVATATEVAAVINRAIADAAGVQGGRIVLASNGAGEDALVSVDVTGSSAAGRLGFGAVPPAAAADVDECEPSVFADNSDRLWLFWSSRRTGTWKIWFSRLDGSAWGAPKQLTTGTLPDREPGVLFDAGAGRIWVFWSRKKANGLWNIFYRHTTKLDFTTLVDADWTEVELQPVPAAPPAGFDNREPMPLLLGNDSLELYFSSNRSNGWNSYSKPLSSATQQSDAQITAGQFTRRAPSPLKTGANEVRLFLRSNEIQIYSSRLYPSARTVDGRYTGATTADTRNPARLSLRQNVQDIQHYTYHTPLRNSSLSADELEKLEETRLYSQDTVVVYLVPDTNDAQLIDRSSKLFEQALKKFLPIQVRVVIRTEQVIREAVYGYEIPGEAPLIDERMIDTILSEGLGPISDSFSDTGGFKFVRTWIGSSNTGVMPDLSVHPPDISFRMPIAGLGEEE